MNTPCCTAAIIDLSTRLVAPATTTLVLAAVFRNFAVARSGRAVADRRPSVVATAGMLAFFACVYLLISRKLGAFPIEGDHARIGVEVLGAALMIAGCVVNLLGRIALGQNWANQATLYEDQTLVTSGVFSIARHPLYSSLIWMFYGSALLYQNVAAALATTIVFVPAMYYRASLEEKMLSERFSDYGGYQQRVGMLFPRLYAPRRIDR
ncbi:MAG: isoprenylcysteine carboxylmethyltransferase family protein [Capsulimonadaceae bacterium]|nr:isoprenylcysteine carboxylmethyltransferase family protein [Capsulimonadaceae bacterium]